MQHCAPETLALAALREPLPDADAAHLDGCADCRAEVASLRRGVDALAIPAFAASAPPVAPPPAVWDAIAAATGATAEPRAGSVPPPVVAVAPAPDDGPRPHRDDVVRELRPRRSRVLPAVAASLLVGAGIGAGAVALATRDDDGAAVVATDLEPLDDRGAAGLAEIVARGGDERLRIELTAPELDDGYYEVWLLEPGARDMFSIGVVRSGTTTTLDLPPGIDLDAFPVVDVSVERLDGDPTHSGVSVARGVLDS